MSPAIGIGIPFKYKNGSGSEPPVTQPVINSVGLCNGDICEYHFVDESRSGFIYLTKLILIGTDLGKVKKEDITLEVGGILYSMEDTQITISETKLTFDGLNHITILSDVELYIVWRGIRLFTSAPANYSPQEIIYPETKPLPELTSTAQYLFAYDFQNYTNEFLKSVKIPTVMDSAPKTTVSLPTTRAIAGEIITNVNNWVINEGHPDYSPYKIISDRKIIFYKGNTTYESNYGPKKFNGIAAEFTFKVTDPTKFLIFKIKGASNFDNDYGIYQAINYEGESYQRDYYIVPEYNVWNALEQSKGYSEWKFMIGTELSTDIEIEFFPDFGASVNAITYPNTGRFQDFRFDDITGITDGMLQFGSGYTNLQVSPLKVSGKCVLMRLKPFIYYPYNQNIVTLNEFEVINGDIYNVNVPIENQFAFNAELPNGYTYIDGEINHSLKCDDLKEKLIVAVVCDPSSDTSPFYGKYSVIGADILNNTFSHASFLLNKIVVLDEIPNEEDLIKLNEWAGLLPPPKINSVSFCFENVCKPAYNNELRNESLPFDSLQFNGSNFDGLKITDFKLIVDGIEFPLEMAPTIITDTTVFISDIGESEFAPQSEMTIYIKDKLAITLPAVPITYNILLENGNTLITENNNNIILEQNG